MVAHCNSDRPAFVGHMADTPETRLLYVYNAMGLPRQHRHQQVLLGRCTDFGAAAALLHAATSSLGVCYRQSRVRFWAASNDEQRGAWDKACKEVGMESQSDGRVTLRDKFPQDPVRGKHCHAARCRCRNHHQGLGALPPAAGMSRGASGLAPGLGGASAGKKTRRAHGIVRRRR